MYDKFHITHTRAAVDEIRRAEFFRKGSAAREVVKGKRRLLWKQSMATSKRCYVVAGAPRSELSAAEGTATGPQQDRIRRFLESRLKCALRHIVVQSLYFRPWSWTYEARQVVGWSDANRHGA